MSVELQALGGEVRARGSMLRAAAAAWLTRRGASSDAQSLVERGSKLGYFKIEGDMLRPVERENPACSCRKQTHAAIAAVPKRLESKAAAQSNPVKSCPKPAVPKGKLSAKSRAKIPACAFADPKGKRFPIHDLGHARAAIPRLAAERKRGNVSAADYKVFRNRIQDALRGFGVEVSEKNPAGNPAHKETVPMAKKAKKTGKAKGKKRRTAKQIAATKKLVAMNKKRGKAKAKPAKARKPARKTTRKAPRKSGTAPKRAKRRAAPATTNNVNVKVGGGTTARKPRKSAKRKTARKATTTTSTKRKVRKSKRHPSRVLRREVTSHVTTQYRYAKSNPVGGTGKMVIGMASAAVGFGAAELLDRLVVTRADQKDKDGNVVKVGSKDNKLYGMAAIIARENHPNMYRFGAIGGGTLVLGAATFAVNRYTKSAIGVAILGGLTFGFGLKLASLGVRWLLPKIIEVKPLSEGPVEESWKTQLFPENGFAVDHDKLPAGVIAGVPRRFTAGAVFRQSFPAAGDVGCGCRACSEERARMAGGCPKARTPQAEQPEQPAVNVEIEQPAGLDATPAQPQGSRGPYVPVMPQINASGGTTPRIINPNGRRMLVIPRQPGKQSNTGLMSVK